MAWSVGGSRGVSILPENTVYGGPSTPAPQRVTLRTLGEKYRQGQLISMVTAYDYPSAVHVRCRAYEAFSLLVTASH